MTEQITVTSIRSNEGTVLVFEGTDEDGNTVTFAADHRPGYDIVLALQEGTEPVVAEVPEYMVIARQAVQS